MPALGSAQGATTIKGLVLGDAGTGKTGGLLSLVKVGYKLRIYDFDNLLGSLISVVKRDMPEALTNGQIMVQTFTDKFVNNAQPALVSGKVMVVQSAVDGIPTAFSDSLKQLNHWKNETEDLGKPADWDDKTIVVVDTLTTLSLAAFRYAQKMNPTPAEGRPAYFAAQQMIMNTLYLLASKQFKPHVLVLAHIDYDKNQNDITKGFARSVGSALNTQIGSVFNCVLLTESQGRNKIIRTNSTGVVDLKNPVSFKVPDTLPIETGYADFFKSVLS